MSDPWTATVEPAHHRDGSGPVTLVEGSTFCISGRGGDIRADLPEGLFFLDTRLLSSWLLTVDGMPLQPLAVSADGPQGSTFVARADRLDSTEPGSVVITRRRLVGRGMREEVSVRHHGLSTRRLTIELTCDVDFASLFDVKLGKVGALPAARTWLTDGHQLMFHRSADTAQRTVRVDFSATPTWQQRTARWQVELAPNAEWTCCIEVGIEMGDQAIDAHYRCGKVTEAVSSARRPGHWRDSAPRLDSDYPRLTRAVSRSIIDLGSLRLFDPAHPTRPVVAAGAPWFMTLFGRDSLITGWMSLLIDADIALGVVEALARLQGSELDEETEEQPGRILHEVRFGDAMSMSLGDGQIYYGSIDATPLFVMLLGELARWGHRPEAVDALVPAADRALAWIDEHGDRDGDGFVEYERRTPRGLLNQGWKDSWDGVPFADGRLPQPPIALCEVQGYVYAAYLARAALAERAGDVTTERAYRSKAATLQAAFERDYWLPERGWYALGLDRDKQPIDALTSNIGHCLWTGIISPERARVVVDHLMDDVMFSGWGVRTLATSMAAYDPLSYHDGSVWPHDNAILAAGLMRYGFVRQAHRVILATLDVAAASNGRLPELFSGIARSEIGVPVSYPSSCSPQAWAAASPLLFVRSLLGFEPDVLHRRLACWPRLPDRISRLSIEGIPLAGRRISIQVEGPDVRVDGLDDGWELVSALDT